MLMIICLLLGMLALLVVGDAVEMDEKNRTARMKLQRVYERVPKTYPYSLQLRCHKKS